MSKAQIVIPENIAPYLEIEHCDDFPVNRYFVTDQQEEIIGEILRMERTVREMHAMNIGYLNTTLLYGPSGTGKTTFARYIAHRLDLDFAYINYAKLFDGIMGDTTKKIDEIFKFMAEKRCIFLMDEIDAISVKRGNESAATGGELSRITITLMQQFDYYKKINVNSIIMAATNVVENMDPALRSRFAIQKEIRQLSNDEKAAWMKMFLDDVGVPYDEREIEHYCARATTVSQRNIESDMIRAIADWVENERQKPFVVKRISR